MSQQPLISRAKEFGIIIMGLTGAGKSTYISQLTKQNVAIGHTLRSCTTRVNVYQYHHANGQRVWLIDTPGFDDTNKVNPAILREIVSFLCAFCNDENVSICGVLYIQRITDIRMSGSSLASLRTFEALCGEAHFGDVTVITTMWDTLQTQTAKNLAQERESALQKEENFFGRLKSGGAEFKRSCDSGSSGATVIDAIVDRGKSVILGVQEELMSNANIKLADTTVGKYVDGNLKLIRQKLEARLNQVEAYDKEEMGDNDELIADIRDQIRLMDQTAGNPEYLNITYEELRREGRVRLETDMVHDVEHGEDTGKSASELKLEHENERLRQDSKELQGQKKLNKAQEREIAQRDTRIKGLKDALAHERAQRDNRYKFPGFFDFIRGRSAMVPMAENEITSVAYGEMRESRQRESRPSRSRKSSQQDRKALDTRARSTMSHSSIEYAKTADYEASHASLNGGPLAYEHSFVTTARSTSPETFSSNGGFPSNVIIDPSGIRRNYSIPSSPVIPRTIPVYEEQQTSPQILAYQHR